MTFEEFLFEAKKQGLIDWTLKSQEVDDGRLDIFEGIFETRMPFIGPKLTQEPRKETRSDNIYPGMLLPPKDAFIFNLRYLLDLAKATKTERSTMERLIKRFEDGENSPKRRTPRKTV